MLDTTTPFKHLPILREHLVDPAQSDYRMTLEVIEQWDRAAAKAGNSDWRYSHEERERQRRQTLNDRLDQDLWVFAFGSLMWDPGFYFNEVRRATLDGFQRSFSLLDTIGRGSPQYPGLMAGLRPGGGCEGVAFRIARPQVEQESNVVWMREMICPGYVAKFHPVMTPQGPIEAMTFEIDETCEDCCDGLDVAETARRIATGRGPGGSNRVYLENLVKQLRILSLNDDAMETLLKSVMAVKP